MSDNLSKEGWRNKEKVNRPCPGHILDIDVGTDEHVTEEKDLPLLRLEDLSSFAVHRLNQRLAKDQRALLRAEQLKKKTGDTLITHKSYKIEATNYMATHLLRGHRLVYKTLEGSQAGTTEDCKHSGRFAVEKVVEIKANFKENIPFKLDCQAQTCIYKLDQFDCTCTIKMEDH